MLFADLESCVRWLVSRQLNADIQQIAPMVRHSRIVNANQSSIVYENSNSAFSLPRSPSACPKQTSNSDFK